MRLRDLTKSRVEVAAVLTVYALFLIVGLYTQTVSIFDVVRVEILGPPEGVQLQSSPIELTAIIADQKGPLYNTNATITVLSAATGETEELRGVTDGRGIVNVLFPAQSGNYTWYVATHLQGYPTVVSRPRSFSTKLALIVDCLYPCSSKYPLFLHTGYFDLQVMVTDMNGNPVESANITFYVNSTVYFTLSDSRGIARLSLSTISPGTYTWFATASKNGEVGASRLSNLVVE